MAVVEARRSVDTSPAAELLEALSSDWLASLDALPVAAYLVDRDRRLRWQNVASIALIGDLRGRLDAGDLSPSDLARARKAFSEKRAGSRLTTLKVSITCADGTRRLVAVSSIPVRRADGEMIGSFGLASVVDAEAAHRPRPPLLTARESEALALLALGCSTAQMAQHMGVAPETARNHIKRLLRRLDAHSRLEAVAKGREMGLL
jgi:DNA-binding CsgD family transcriptional regulator